MSWTYFQNIAYVLRDTLYNVFWQYRDIDLNYFGNLNLYLHSAYKSDCQNILKAMLLIIGKS